MVLWKRIATVASILVLLSACVSDEQAELRGSLYFAAGNYLALMDLRDGSTSVEANLGDVQIHTISPHQDSRILVSLVGGENDFDTRRLVLYDIRSRQTLTLLSGAWHPSLAIMLAGFSFAGGGAVAISGYDAGRFLMGSR